MLQTELEVIKVSASTDPFFVSPLFSSFVCPFFPFLGQFL